MTLTVPEAHRVLVAFFDLPATTRRELLVRTGVVDRRAAQEINTRWRWGKVIIAVADTCWDDFATRVERKCR